MGRARQKGRRAGGSKIVWILGTEIRLIVSSLALRLSFSYKYFELLLILIKITLISIFIIN